MASHRPDVREFITFSGPRAGRAALFEGYGGGTGASAAGDIDLSARERYWRCCREAAEISPSAAAGAGAAACSCGTDIFTLLAAGGGGGSGGAYDRAPRRRIVYFWGTLAGRRRRRAAIHSMAEGAEAQRDRAAMDHQTFAAAWGVGATGLLSGGTNGFSGIPWQGARRGGF